jgi:hypothetical protein
MSPADLKAYLDVLRAANVMSAEVVTGPAVIKVVFGPEMPGDPIDKERGAGEWKRWAGEGNE